MRFRMEYMNMVELGKLFGVSGHQVGKWLKQAGLRRDYGSPSSKAYDQRLVSYDYERHGTYTTLWNAEKVVCILEEAGHQRIVNPPPELVEPPMLIGPFSLRESDNNTWQLVGKNGEVAVVVTGQTNARAVERVMNIAHRSGITERLISQSQ